MTKINLEQSQSKEAINSLLNLTNGKETQEERNERIKEEVLSEVFG